jgi:hypothetical protein
VEGGTKEYQIEQQEGEKNAPLEGNVETRESHKSRDRNMVEDKGARVCIER